MRVGKLLNVLLVVGLLLPLVAAGVLLQGDANEGKAAFAKRCKMCHGADGDGNPAMARMLKVEFKPMSSDHVQALKDSELTDIVVKGKGKMTAVRGVTEKEVADIIAYLRTLKAE